MSFLHVKRLSASPAAHGTLDSSETDPGAYPEKIVLEPIAPPGSNRLEPVRIFVGTEPRQYRAERVFIWSIVKCRNPARAYEIHLMKDLPGFDRRRWTTGFTNYRFAIPDYTGGFGRAIYNDVDQVYLADPGELFDIDMNGRGFLAISPEESSVMLIDCARMRHVWNLQAARQGTKKRLLARALSEPTMYGPLDGSWNARDWEYRAGRSRLLHFTTLHWQPWRPFPDQFIYQRNPHESVWFDLEAQADDAGFQVFDGVRRRSRSFTRLAAAASDRRVAGGMPELTGPGRRGETLAALLGENHRTLAVATLDPDWPAEDASAAVRRLTPPESPWDGRPGEPADTVVAAGALDFVPDHDVPWMIERLFQTATERLYIAVGDFERDMETESGAALHAAPRPWAWWLSLLESAARRHRHVRWTLEQLGTKHGRPVLRWARDGGPKRGETPRVWVLTDDRPGNQTQGIGLAEAIGWPYRHKVLRPRLPSILHNRLIGPRLLTIDKARSATLDEPWPDLVIGVGRRVAPANRWIQEQSRGRTRTVHVGRKGGHVAEWFDAVVTPAYCRLPPDPNRIETTTPMTPVDDELLERAAANRPGLMDDLAAPRVVLLVGGWTLRHRLPPAAARRMAAEVRAFAEQAGGSVVAVTSRRTSRRTVAALQDSLGDGGRVEQWRPGRSDNPYLAYLALADVLVVTGDSESMLAEAAATTKPLYIYPIPERPMGPRLRLSEWIYRRSLAGPANNRGTIRPQQGLEYLCALAIKKGWFLPPRNLDMLHHNLVRLGAAQYFGTPLRTTSRAPLRPTRSIASRVGRLLDLVDASATDTRSSPILAAGRADAASAEVH